MNRFLTGILSGLAIIGLAPRAFAQISVPAWSTTTTEAILDTGTDTLTDQVIALLTFILTWGVPILVIFAVVRLIFRWIRGR
jgi:hypothetical protein